MLIVSLLIVTLVAFVVLVTLIVVDCKETNHWVRFYSLPIGVQDELLREFKDDLKYLPYNEAVSLFIKTTKNHYSRYKGSK